MSETKSIVPKNPPPGPVFPVLPPAHNFSVLGNPNKFQAYIATELPLAFGTAGDDSPMPPPPPPTEKLRRNVNSTFLNSLLKKPHKVMSGTLDWVTTDVFPDCKLPVRFDIAVIYSSPMLWNNNTVSFPRFPTNMTEMEIQSWLNNIANNLAVVHNITGNQITRGDRTFDARTATKGPSGSFMLRKPDISVIDRTSKHNATRTLEERLHWRNIYAFIEVTGNNSGPASNVLRQISQKAACIFDVQPQRKFVCALGIFGEPAKLMFMFVLVDRAGITHTPPTPITSYAATTFMRILFALCYASQETLGWDPSMKVDPITNEVTSIDVTGFESGSTTLTTRTFDIVKLIYSSPVLYSRGTRVWIVKDKDGSFCVLKDSWVLAANAVSEIEFTKHIEKIIKEEPEGYLFKYTCPLYCIGQDCVCSTDSIRGILPNKPPTRHQRRIVTAIIGDPITSFRSKKEFVAMYLDLVNALEFLNTKGNVIHGDLSINNILINRVWHHGIDDAPSQLRDLAVSNLDSHNNSMSQSESESVSDKAPIIHSPAITAAAVVHSSAIAAPVVQGPRAPYVSPSVGYGGTLEPIESAGMIIDCDFMRYTNQDTHQTSGTLPFMAIEALLPTANDQFRHHAGHDLECLLNTMITICHYTVGPSGQLREAVPGDQRIKLNDWFTMDDRLNLAAAKSTTLEAFNTFIKPVLPKYWEDFAPFLQSLIKATWKDMPFIEQPNIATHQAYRDILKAALAQYTNAENDPPGVYASVPIPKRPLENSQPSRYAKRPRQGEGGSSEPFIPRRSQLQFFDEFKESAGESRRAPNVNSVAE